MGLKKRTSNQTKPKAKADLFDVGRKLLGLGYLLKFQDSGAAPTQDEMAGVGQLVTEMGENVLEIHEHLELHGSLNYRSNED